MIYIYSTNPNLVTGGIAKSIQSLAIGLDEINVQYKIIPTHEDGSIRFSGIDWSARLSNDTQETSVAANTSCIITGVDGNTMLVKPLS